LEERRSAFAKALLQWMGRESALPAASQPSSTADPAATTDPVDAAILQRLEACKADGTLADEVALWKLDSPETVAELVLLATAPPGSTEKAPVLCQARTPRLFERFIPMLFVGFAHNLYVESAVSKLANLEKTHPNLDALTLQEMLLYKARQEESKCARLDASLRSQVAGGLRKAAVERAEKPLSGSPNDSKLQQLKLCSQVETRSKEYQTAELLRRGDDSVCTAVRDAHCLRDLAESCCNVRKVGSMAASCKVTEKGNKRKAPLTTTACDNLTIDLAEPFAKLHKLMGSRLKQKSVDKALKAEQKARKADRAVEATKATRKRPVQRSGKGERAAANRAQPRPSRVQTQQTRAQPPRAAATTAREALAAESSGESEAEDDAGAEEGDDEIESEGEDSEGEEEGESEGEEEEGNQGDGEAMEGAEGAQESVSGADPGAESAAPSVLPTRTSRWLPTASQSPTPQRQNRLYPRPPRALVRTPPPLQSNHRHNSRWCRSKPRRGRLPFPEHRSGACSGGHHGSRQQCGCMLPPSPNLPTRGLGRV